MQVIQMSFRVVVRERKRIKSDEYRPHGKKDICITNILLVKSNSTICTCYEWFGTKPWAGILSLFLFTCFSLSLSHFTLYDFELPTIYHSLQEKRVQGISLHEPAHPNCTVAVVVLERTHGGFLQQLPPVGCFRHGSSSGVGENTWRVFAATTTCAWFRVYGW
ncbi:unnamed protein product [Lathyrus sativus]|nr:unnamed protein product [Lathyrus sativus]